MRRTILYEVTENLMSLQDYSGSNSSDVFTLYSFYFHVSQRQETDKIKCTGKYTYKTLGWGFLKYKRAHEVLLKTGYISEVKNGDNLYLKLVGIHYQKDSYGERFLARSKKNKESDSLAKKSDFRVSVETPPIPKIETANLSQKDDAQKENILANISQADRDSFPVQKEKNIIFKESHNLAKKSDFRVSVETPPLSQLRHTLNREPLTGFTVPFNLKVEDKSPNQNCEPKLPMIMPEEKLPKIKLGKPSQKTSLSPPGRRRLTSEEVAASQALDKLSSDLQSKIGNSAWGESRSQSRIWLKNMDTLKKEIGEDEFWYRVSVLTEDTFTRKNLDKTSSVFYKIKSFVPRDVPNALYEKLYRLWEGFPSKDGDDRFAQGAAREKRLTRYGFNNMVNEMFVSGKEYIESIATPELLKRVEEALKKEGMTMGNRETRKTV